VNNNLFAAIRGPILLIAVGVLLAIDHAGIFGIRQSWPVLLVLLGLLKLMEHLTTEPRQPAPPMPPMPPMPGGN
jgi:hypothetical protein